MGGWFAYRVGSAGGGGGLRLTYEWIGDARDDRSDRFAVEPASIISDRGPSSNPGESDRRHFVMTPRVCPCPSKEPGNSDRDAVDDRMPPNKMWTDRSVRSHEGCSWKTAIEKKTRRCSDEANLARQEEILETATELFAEHGFSDAVTQALADRLGVGKGTIYRHFPSKRELFLAAADRVMRKMQEQINCEHRRGSRTAWSGSSGGIATFLPFFADHPAFVELLDPGAGLLQGSQAADLLRAPRGQRPAVAAALPRLDRRGAGPRHARSSRSPTWSATSSTGSWSPTSSTASPSRSESQAKEILDIVFLGILSEPERGASLASERGHCRLSIAEASTTPGFSCN